jgi:hypothetical protein
MSKKRVRKVTSRKTSAEDKDPTTPRNRAPFRAACAIVTRKYCDWFSFWRNCRYKPCSSARRCVGDEHACLKKHWYSLPYNVRLDAHGRMEAEALPNADRWLRLAHRYPPDTLCRLFPSDRYKAPRQTGKQTEAQANNGVGS